MRSPWSDKCLCGEELQIQIVGTQKIPNGHCPKCGTPFHIIDNGFISTRVFYRAKAELADGDYSIAILLAAMAVEAELARLFVKWNALDAEPYEYPHDEDRWLTEWQKERSVKQQFEKVTQLVSGHSFNAYVELHHKELDKVIPTQFIGWKDLDFEKIYDLLFRKRNKIVHEGRIDNSSSEASQAVEVARASLLILQRMDKERAIEMDKRNREKSSAPQIS